MFIPQQEFSHIQLEIKSLFKHIVCLCLNIWVTGVCVCACVCTCIPATFLTVFNKHVSVKLRQGIPGTKEEELQKTRSSLPCKHAGIQMPTSNQPGTTATRPLLPYPLKIIFAFTGIQRGDKDPLDIFRMGLADPKP